MHPSHNPERWETKSQSNRLPLSAFQGVKEESEFEVADDSEALDLLSEVTHIPTHAEQIYSLFCHECR